ncbi:MAG: methyltransferase domain-containing protein [Spirochaetes bacterium]|nr:methyltransferase domain-containing protein [Spirochaetota bacterium]
MDRLNEIITFLEHDSRNRVVIEPEKRHAKLLESLLDVVKTYNPGVIVKAGLGNGQLLRELAANSGSYIVVVEPSMRIIRDFMERHAGDTDVERIRFINGDFNSFPVDYYAADLLVSIDNLDFLETGMVVDEFRRALQFDGILFLSGVVLHDDDLEGLYDDFMKSAFPLHNDYYLRDDLKTVLDLNEFKFIKGHIEYYKTDLSALTDYFGSLYKNRSGAPMSLIDGNREKFSELYHIDSATISEPYYIGVFMRKKPEKKQ